jgi:hypothetical protein
VAAVKKRQGVVAFAFAFTFAFAVVRVKVIHSSFKFVENRKLLCSALLRSGTR